MVVHQRVKSLQRISFPSEMTSHDIRLKVPAKQSCSKIVRRRKREGTGGGRWKKSPWRTGPLSRFSPALPPPLFLFILLSQSLTGFFRRAHASGSGSLAQKPAIMANRRGGERELRTLSRSSGDATFLPSSRFSYFARNAIPECRWVEIELSPFYARPCTR